MVHYICTHDMFKQSAAQASLEHMPMIRGLVLITVLEDGSMDVHGWGSHQANLLFLGLTLERSLVTPLL